MTYWSGIVDESDLCYLNGTPYGLMDVMGLRSTEIDGLYDGESNTGVPAEGNKLCMTDSYTCRNLCELVKTSTAEEILIYVDDFYAGLPALTCNAFGEGKAYYICADFDQEFYDDFYAKAAAEAGIELVVSDIPKGVEVTTRENDKAVYVFVQNFNRKTVEVKLPVEEYALWQGEYDGTMKSLSTVVLKKNK